MGGGKKKNVGETDRQNESCLEMLSAVFFFVAASSKHAKPRHDDHGASFSIVVPISLGRMAR